MKMNFKYGEIIIVIMVIWGNNIVKIIFYLDYLCYNLSFCYEFLLYKCLLYRILINLIYFVFLNK